jgi:hypothetical protein
MDDIYKDTMSQREFMLAALQSDEDIKPRDVQAFWKQKKAVESVDKQQTLKPQSMVPVRERRLLKQRGSRLSATHPLHHAG